jgi:acyl carrier protein
MSSDIRNTIRDYVQRELMQDRAQPTLGDDTNLLKQHIVDSLGIFMLVTFLEKQFGIVVDEDEMVGEHFETVADVADLVESKLEAAAAARPA